MGDFWLSVSFLLVVTGGSPAETTERIRTKYELAIGELHTKQISENGWIMKIGSQPLTMMGDESSLVKCTLHENIHDYKEEHRTEIHIYTIGSNGQAEYEKVTNEFGDFFVHIKKDLWSCSHSTDTKLRFSRVVNRLFGVKEIQDVKYHDAIEVTTKHYLGIQKTAEIMEVKYIFTNETHSFPVRYLGELQEEIGNSNTGERVVDTVGSTSLIEDNQAVPGEAESKRELHTEHSGNKWISNDGISLIVRYNYPNSSNLGDESSTAKCVEEQGIHPFPDQYALSFALRVQKHGKTFNAEILKEERHEYFIPINQEIWMCRIDEEQGEIFFRVVNEVLGRKAVKNVTYHQGVNSLYKIQLGEKVTIRLKEIRYFDGLTFVDRNYLGKVRLDKKQPLQRIYNGKDGEVPFLLNDNRLFRLLIGSEGYDIRVGQRWEFQYDKSLQKVKCSVDSGVDYLEVYRPKFRLKAKTENKISKTYSLETPDMYTKQQFVHYLKGEISMCHDNQNKKVFYRVYNEMSVLVPVHAIEFYDGVFVFPELINGMKSKTVRVIEIKYLSLRNMRVVKYEGKVDSRDSKPITMLKVSQVMRVTAEDVVWSVGHFPDINMDIVDEKSFIRQNSIPYDDQGRMQYNDNGEFGLVFGEKTENMEKIGNLNGLAECTLLGEKQGVRTVPTFLEVSRPTKKMVCILEALKLDFFKKINIDELWDCKDTSGVRFIYQRFDRVLRNTFTKQYKAYENIKFFGLAPGRLSLFNFVMIGDDSYLHIQQDKYIRVETSNDKSGKSIKKYTVGNYVGQMLFKGGADSPKKSGTMLLQEDEEEITRSLHYYTAEISYVVGREWIYKSELGSEGGDSLYIGTKWQRVIGNAETKTTCERLNDVDGGMFDAFYRTRIRKADEMSSKRMRTPNQSLYEKYFSTLKQEVWQCGINKGEIRMLRILNHFFIQKHGLVKEMLYYDGVTILLGRVHGAGLFTEVIEIKYLDVNDFTVLKYEGIVILLQKDKTELSDGMDALMFLKNQVARLENYYLPKGQVHRTSISDKGVLLEIGIESDETINIPHLVCERRTDPLPAHTDKYRPRIYINSVTDSHIQPQIMTIRDIHSCFTSTVSLWHCKDGAGTEKTYARAVTQLTLKESCLKIATILHYDSVLIQKKPKLTIREIKFYKDTEHEKTVRIEGFVHLEQTPASAEGVGQDSQKISVTRVNYELDEVKLHVKQIKQDSGPIIEVGSPYQATFGTETDAVL
ncbi:uncharacterized protein LOC111054806 isoform X2 [Nilaparvata lugens]|uniref:uncharacterized protein LOC111054806 isoform X1 n=1 Tax=Nilaparvata lugens TaxID=108931 RepID=UPI00193DE23E|nr:uncharacterized protein LOC111054806 isoform X1 [Nilaparvata lugens]XP_039275841.1 uncharacterized protein LOC111054806 isoform X2 [Nilaparvata lugens]